MDIPMFTSHFFPFCLVILANLFSVTIAYFYCEKMTFSYKYEKIPVHTHVLTLPLTPLSPLPWILLLLSNYKDMVLCIYLVCLSVHYIWGKQYLSFRDWLKSITITPLTTISCNWHDFALIHAWKILRCIYVTFVNPLVCCLQWFHSLVTVNSVGQKHTVLVYMRSADLEVFV